MFNQNCWNCFKTLNVDLRADSKFNSSSKFGFWKFWISIFVLVQNSTPARNLAFYKSFNFDLRVASKFNSTSKFGFWKILISISSWLEIQVKLEIRILKILNFDLRTGLKFNTRSKFRFWKFWNSIFELARNLTQARN
jgi:hypothetical protein